MRPAPLLFATALLFLMVKDGEVRFLLVQLDVDEDAGMLTDPGSKIKLFMSSIVFGR